MLPHRVVHFTCPVTLLLLGCYLFVRSCQCCCDDKSGLEGVEEELESGESAEEERVGLFGRKKKKPAGKRAAAKKAPEGAGPDVFCIREASVDTKASTAGAAAGPARVDDDIADCVIVDSSSTGAEHAPGSHDASLDELEKAIAEEITPMVIGNADRSDQCIDYIWTDDDERDDIEQDNLAAIGVDPAEPDKATCRPLMQALMMTLFAELGIRSQVLILVLAAVENPYGVCLGAIAGRTVCIGIAVASGKLLAQGASSRVVGFLGGALLVSSGAYAMSNALKLHAL